MSIWMLKLPQPWRKLETLNFQQLFIKTTFARTAAEWWMKIHRLVRVPVFFVKLISPGSLNPESSLFAGRNYKQYRQNLYQLESLEDIPDMPGKKFVIPPVGHSSTLYFYIHR